MRSGIPAQLGQLEDAFVLYFPGDRTNSPNSEPSPIELCSELERSTDRHICVGNVKRLGMREGAMSDVRNWASAAVVGALILLAPIIAFAVVVMAEMLSDLMAKLGPPVVWPVAAAALGWVLLRKFGAQPQTSRLRSEGA